MTFSAIAAARPRRRTTLTGRIITVKACSRPWVRCDVDLGDDSGTITLRFLGRRALPGMFAGRRLRVEGTPLQQGEVLIMLNPNYSFVAEDSGCSG